MEPIAVPRQTSRIIKVTRTVKKKQGKNLIWGISRGITLELLKTPKVGLALGTEKNPQPKACTEIQLATLINGPKARGTATEGKKMTMGRRLRRTMSIKKCRVEVTWLKILGKNLMNPESLIV